MRVSLRLVEIKNGFQMRKFWKVSGLLKLGPLIKKQQCVPILMTYNRTYPSYLGISLKQRWAPPWSGLDPAWSSGFWARDEHWDHLGTFFPVRMPGNNSKITEPEILRNGLWNVSLKKHIGDSHVHLRSWWLWSPYATNLSLSWGE